MFLGLMSQCMIPLSCAANRVFACGAINTQRTNMRHRKPAYYDGHDPERVFEAQRTIFLDVSFQIDPTHLHAQVTIAIVDKLVVQFRDTLYPIDDAVKFSFSFYRLRITEFDESLAVILQVMGVVNVYERLDSSTRVACGMHIRTIRTTMERYPAQSESINSTVGDNTEFRAYEGCGEVSSAVLRGLLEETKLNLVVFTRTAIKIAKTIRSSTNVVRRAILSTYSMIFSPAKRILSLKGGQ